MLLNLANFSLLAPGKKKKYLKSASATQNSFHKTFYFLFVCEQMHATEVTANVVYQLDKYIFTTCFLRWVQLQEKELI